VLASKVEIALNHFQLILLAVVIISDALSANGIEARQLLSTRTHLLPSSESTASANTPALFNLGHPHVLSQSPISFLS
jgi:hypothetical protein